jgi:hypothetical protein
MTVHRPVTLRFLTHAQLRVFGKSRQEIGALHTMTEIVGEHVMLMTSQQL